MKKIHTFCTCSLMSVVQSLQSRFRESRRGPWRLSDDDDDNDGDHEAHEGGGDDNDDDDNCEPGVDDDNNGDGDSDGVF